jgi:hypothetical protein
MAMMALMSAASFLTGIFGIILLILILFVCIVWLIFPFIAMKWLREIREEIEKGNRYLANISDRNALTLQSSPRPRVRIVPTAKIVPIATGIPTTEVVPPPSIVPLKISKGGREVGLKDTTSIKIMLKKGELSLDDHYFDAGSNAWVTLDCHPEFSQ